LRKLGYFPSLHRSHSLVCSFRADERQGYHRSSLAKNPTCETIAAVKQATAAASINDPREIFGWAMYDWANSAFSTTVAGGLLSPYVTTLAQAAVGDNGTVINLGLLGAITAKSFFPLCISVSVFLQVFILPVLGAIADYSHLKKFLMATFCYIGAIATCLLIL